MLTPSLTDTSLARVLASRWALRLADLTIWFLVVALAYLLARLTWTLVPLPEQQQRPVQGTMRAAEPSVTVSNPLEQVARLHLFGEAQRVQRKAVPAAVTAPETKLDLVLKGVLASENRDQARAFIAQANGSEERYAIDAYLPGRVQLAEILADRVILRRNDRYETLYLEKESVSGRGIRSTSRKQKLSPAPVQGATGGRRKRAP